MKVGAIGGVIKLSKLDGDFLELKGKMKKFGITIFSALYRGLFVLGITLIICISMIRLIGFSITGIHGSRGTLVFVVEVCFHRVFKGLYHVFISLPNFLKSLFCSCSSLWTFTDFVGMVFLCKFEVCFFDLIFICIRSDTKYLKISN